MPMRRWIPLVIATLALGCAKEPPDVKVMGIWTGDPPLQKEFKEDPKLRDLAEFLKDSLQLHLKSNHTYRLDCWGTKEGKWKLSNRLISMEETTSRSILGDLLGEGPELGSVDSSGKRTYSAVISKDEKTLTILMGKLGDVEFHR